jgi:hypothetical protein
LLIDVWLAAAIKATATVAASKIREKIPTGSPFSISLCDLVNQRFIFETQSLTFFGLLSNDNA